MNIKVNFYDTFIDVIGIVCTSIASPVSLVSEVP